MRADFSVVLDACVIVLMPLADTLFRMAEHPRLYIPKWTEEIMGEASRTLISKFHLTQQQADRREAKIKQAFPSSSVDDSYKLLIPAMQNDPKDRHVLAAAVRSQSEVIVTYNRRHFPESALSPFGVTCMAPSSFLRSLFDLEPSIATRKIVEQAECIGLTFEQLLLRLKPAVPGFVDFLCEEMNTDLQ